MKVFVRLFTLALLAGALYSFSGPQTSTDNNNGAFIDQNFMCGMYDADGGYYIGAGTVSVITGNGKNIVVCQASGVPNSTRRAAIFSNFSCATFLGETNDSHEVVTPSGQATLQCKF